MLKFLEFVIGKITYQELIIENYNLDKLTEERDKLIQEKLYYESKNQKERTKKITKNV